MGINPDLKPARASAKPLVIARNPTPLTRRPYHQQPDVNYFKVLEKVDFTCTVPSGTLQGKSIEG